MHRFIKQFCFTLLVTALTIYKTVMGPTLEHILHTPYKVHNSVIISH